MKAGQQDPKANSDTRTLILDATEQIMAEEGYAGVSSRKVAARAGLKSNLVHYYFPTMDDLFIAAFHRLEDGYDARFARAAASSKPLRNLWLLAKESVSAKLILEFTALASHRPAVREIIGRSARRDRSIMTAALDAVFARYGIDREQFPPKVVAMLMAGITRALSTERVLGADDGHSEMLEFVDRLLREVEPTGHAKGTDDGSSGAKPLAPPD